MSRLPDSFGIQLPPEWIEIGVDRETFDERWKVMQREYREGPNWSRPAERQLEIFFEQIRLLVEQERVVFCAGLLAAREPDEAVDPETPHGPGDPTPLMAACAISVLTRVELGTDLPLTPEVVVTAYTNERGPQSEFADLEPPAVVEVGRIGPGVRLARLLRKDTVQGDKLRLFVQSYMVTIADGEALAVLQFSTPNSDEAREFSELFGAIAGTLRAFYEDTPTFEPEPAG